MSFILRRLAIICAKIGHKSLTIGGMRKGGKEGERGRKESRGGGKNEGRGGRRKAERGREERRIGREGGRRPRQLCDQGLVTAYKTFCTSRLHT